MTQSMFHGICVVTRRWTIPNDSISVRNSLLRYVFIHWYNICFDISLLPLTEFYCTMKKLNEYLLYLHEETNGRILIRRTWLIELPSSYRFLHSNLITSPCLLMFVLFIFCGNTKHIENIKLNSWYKLSMFYFSFD